MSALDAARGLGLPEGGIAGSTGVLAFDLARVLRALHVPGSVSDEERQRVRQGSYDEPQGFVSALAASLPLPLPRKSDLSAGIDLWSDLIEPWSDESEERVALRHYDELAGWQTLTYRELGARSILLSQVLQQRGCASGHLLALVLPFGSDFLIGFCAALRLGLQLAPLLPRASGLLSAQLAVLAPHTIYTAIRYRRLLSSRDQAAVLCADAPLRKTSFSATAPPSADGLKGDLPVPNRPGTSVPISPTARLSREVVRDSSHPLTPPGSHTYGGDDPLLKLCSPLSANAPTAVVEVSARAVYAGALRDALLLGLKSGAEARGDTLGLHLMAPRLHLSQHAPSVVTAVLAAGASLVDVPMTAALRDPGLWSRGRVPVHHLFLPTDLPETDLQTLLQCAAQGLLPDLRRLFVCPFLARAHVSARLFSMWLTQGMLPVVVTSLLHIDAASGGAVLYSDPLRSVPSQALHVALACSHQLEDPQRRGQPTTQTSGRLRLLATPPVADGELLLARLPSGYFLGGTQTLRRRGRRFLKDRLLAFIRHRAIGNDCTVIQRMGPSDGEFHLLIFSGESADARGDTAQSTEAIRSEIDTVLGPLAVPDRILVLPIYPRMRAAQIDHSFYQSSHDTGLLARLYRDPALRSISTLRGLLRRLREAV